MADQSPSAEMKRAALQEDPRASEEPIKEDDQRGEEDSGGSSQARPTVQEYKPRVPYPSMLKADKEDTQFKKFMKFLSSST